MITDVTINYINDNTVEVEKKKKFIENLGLTYSDIFELIERCEDYDVRQILHSYIFSYVDGDDPKFKSKITNQKNRRSKSYKEKKMKRIRRMKSYD